MLLGFELVPLEGNNVCESISPAVVQMRQTIREKEKQLAAQPPILGLFWIFPLSAAPETAQVFQTHRDGSLLVGVKQPHSRTTLCFFGQQGVEGAHTTAAHNHVCARFCSNCQERLSKDRTRS